MVDNTFIMNNNLYQIEATSFLSEVPLAFIADSIIISKQHKLKQIRLLNDRI